jgi:hypothetical protein
MLKLEKKVEKNGQKKMPKISKKLMLVMVQCWLTQGQEQNKVTKIQ